MMKHEVDMSVNNRWIIMLAKEGNESAFRELYENNYEMIYQLAYRYSKSQQDAEDILQETFIKAFKGIKKFDFNVSTNFPSWIYQIGINCSLDHLRKRKKRKADQVGSLTDIHNEPKAQDPSPEKSTIVNQTVSQVKDALKILSPRQRIIFDLRHLQHRALKEISDQLQCSQSTVKKQLQRAVSKLRNQLEPLWREE
ncbi:MAG: RNA polymerase sigma factor [Candidatus Aminicenantes bacterium]|nr:MAG: RNA polymerase sigma factor [Candidatus Aminicenantes bacterium]